MEEFAKTFTVNISKNRGSVAVAQDILNCTREFQGYVYIKKNGKTILANSLIGILSLGLEDGDIIKVVCSGNGEFESKLCLNKIGDII